jgi:hypothetical protein
MMLNADKARETGAIQTASGSRHDWPAMMGYSQEALHRVQA